jgi:hypothetical protein
MQMCRCLEFGTAAYVAPLADEIDAVVEVDDNYSVVHVHARMYFGCILGTTPHEAGLSFIPLVSYTRV